MTVQIANRQLASGYFAGRQLAGVFKGSTKLWPTDASGGTPDVLFAGLTSSTSTSPPYQIVSAQDIKAGDKLVMCVMTDGLPTTISVTDNHAGTFSAIDHIVAADGRGNSIWIFQYTATEDTDAGDYTATINYGGDEYIQAGALLVLRGATWSLDTPNTKKLATGYAADAMPVGPVTTALPGVIIVLASSALSESGDLVLTGTDWTVDVTGMTNQTVDHLPFLVTHKMSDSAFSGETASVNYPSSGQYDRKTMVQVVFTYP